MTFEEIQKANAAINTTTIQKKQYAEVNQRIKAFRMLYPEGTIETEIVSLMDGICVIKATVSADGKVLGTGTAYEKEGNGFINKTSYIENCETSAVGRALAMCGIGIDTSLASYEEVANAKLQQEEKHDDPIKEADARMKVLKYINECKMTKENVTKLCKAYSVESISEMTTEQCNDYLNKLRENGKEV